MAPDPEPAPDGDERKRARLAAALLGFVAVVQLLAMVTGSRDPIALFWQFAVVLPAAAFALGWWRERRPRVASIVFALLWSTLNTVEAVQLVRFTPTMATELGIAVPPIPRWFIPLFSATSITFTTATIVIVTGRSSRERRIAGAAAAAVFALLFVAQHVAYLTL